MTVATIAGSDVGSVYVVLGNKHDFDIGVRLFGVTLKSSVHKILSMEDKLKGIGDLQIAPIARFRWAPTKGVMSPDIIKQKFPAVKFTKADAVHASAVLPMPEITFRLGMDRTTRDLLLSPFMNALPEICKQLMGLETSVSEEQTKALLAELDRGLKEYRKEITSFVKSNED